MNTAPTIWRNFSIEGRQIISTEVAREKLVNILWGGQWSTNAEEIKLRLL